MIKAAELMAEAVVYTVRESLLVLDHGFRIRLASRSFYLTFRVTPEESLDRSVYEIRNGENLPIDLDLLIERTVVSPYHPQWALSVLQNAVDSAGLRITVEDSGIYRKPPERP